MKFLTFSKKSNQFLPKPQPKISLLIPFSSSDRLRKRHFDWLLTYWKHELPNAEIIIGKSSGRVFCKGEALNDAASRASGKVLVLLDADAYLPGDVIERCADRIIEDIDNHLWYVPYKRLYRLTKEATSSIIKSNPTNPKRISNINPDEFENTEEQSKAAPKYAAMIAIIPREALDVIGCFDERFRGWGSEDIAMLRALDTLYGKHKTTRNSVFHLWHPVYVDGKMKKWKNQTNAGTNNELSNRYNRATRVPEKMRDIVEEACRFKKLKRRKKRKPCFFKRVCKIFEDLIGDDCSF